MAGFTTYLQQKVLDHVRGKTSFTMPTAYVALFTTNPTDAGGGTEAYWVCSRYNGRRRLDGFEWCQWLKRQRYNIWSMYSRDKHYHRFWSL
jgi:hypothetical protein